MSQPELRRTLGLTSAINITVGAVIGSGIFFKALDVSRNLPSEAWIFAAWIVLGIVCLFGAFAYAELGAMFPEAGGQYAFLREAFGRFPAFLYGWTFLLVINSGTMAALAAAFAQALSRKAGFALDEVYFSVPLVQGLAFELGPAKLWACGMILLLGVVNHFGVDWGALIQNLSTFAKVGALATIVGGGVLFALPDGAAAAPAAAAAANPDFLAGLVVAAVAIFWAYEGWYQLPFNAAELKNPHRDLPRGLIWGVLLLIGVYLAVNAVYLLVVPIGEMRGLGSDFDVPYTVVSRVFGVDVAGLLAFLIALSVFGAANPNLLSSPRGFYAMANDGLLPRRLNTVHPRWRTPTVAIWSQALWAMLLIVLFPGFKDLTVYVVFASLLFYALTVAGVYVLRIRAPERERPYRCFGYPFTPLLFIGVTLFVDGYTLLDPNERTNALVGLGILGAGVVVYAAFLRRPR